MTTAIYITNVIAAITTTNVYIYVTINIYFPTAIASIIVIIITNEITEFRTTIATCVARDLDVMNIFCECLFYGPK